MSERDPLTLQRASISSNMITWSLEKSPFCLNSWGWMDEPMEKGNEERRDRIVRNKNPIQSEYISRSIEVVLIDIYDSNSTDGNY